METIHQQNFCDSGVKLDILKKDMVPRMRKNKVIDIRELYIGFACCRVKDFIEPLHCYKCQSKCKCKEVCSIYAQEGHNHKVCKEKGQEQCANCRRENKEHLHRVDHRDYPAYTRAYEMEIVRWKDTQGRHLGEEEGKILEDISNEHHLVVQLMIGYHQIRLVSSYFQFFESMESHMESWDRILDKLHNKGTVTACDLNAKSTLWYSPVRDEKSTLVEQYITAQDLRDCNQAGQILTYVSPARETEIFIDVTLATSKANPVNTNHGTYFSRCPTSVLTLRGKLEMFYNLLVDKMEELLEEEDPQASAHRITTAIQIMCNSALRRVTSRTPCNMW
ncbi:hypothetical protein PR048_027006 [Dryococelus australis]|uniref:Endonuclease/exonuclease/phosphatase domain-containing protein n=1 Tax=Dryococelus australis TaxID=614101 RepID=A0ABQ9GMZ0_9NEOP|nr:hypothetical protein PR048_027006 [Dryococelus australis]